VNVCVHKSDHIFLSVYSCLKSTQSSMHASHCDLTVYTVFSGLRESKGQFKLPFDDTKRLLSKMPVHHFKLHV